MGFGGGVQQIQQDNTGGGYFGTPGDGSGGGGSYEGGGAFGGPPTFQLPDFTLPTLPTAQELLPDFSVSAQEREQRLSNALNGLQNASGGYENQFREAAVRSGLNPQSGPALGVLRNLISEGMNTQGRVRSEAFLQEEDMRRQREEIIAQLGSQLAQANLGAHTSLKGAQISSYPSFINSMLNAEKLPLELLTMLRNIYEPFGITPGDEVQKRWGNLQQQRL